MRLEPGPEPPIPAHLAAPRRRRWRPDSPQLAIRDAETPPSTPIPVPSIPQQPPVAYLPVRPPAGPQVSNSPGVLGSDEAPQGNQAPTTPEPRRLLVRDAEGKAVVAREHGMMKDQMAVVLPDGTIGWPTTQVFTDEPFVPNTIDELERTLQDGEYSTFRVVKTKHYLVFYQSSERFARDSADLLEDLYEKLTGALQRQKLPVTPAEFPLIAVIFRTEDDFRANRKVPAEVQAYYEILSNRIFFFEKGKRDRPRPRCRAPEAADRGARGDAPAPPQRRDPAPDVPLAALAGRRAGRVLLAPEADQAGGRLGGAGADQPHAPDDDPRPRRPDVVGRPRGPQGPVGARPGPTPGRVPRHPDRPDPDRLRPVVGSDPLPRPRRDRSTSSSPTSASSTGSARSRPGPPTSNWPTSARRSARTSPSSMRRSASTSPSSRSPTRRSCPTTPC